MSIYIKDKMKIICTELSYWGHGDIKKNLWKYIKKITCTNFFSYILLSYTIIYKGWAMIVRVGIIRIY